MNFTKLTVPKTKKAIRQLEEDFTESVQTGNRKEARRCLREGVNPNLVFNHESPIHFVTENNDIKMAKVLLSYPSTDINKKDFFGLTPLLVACRFGKMDFVKLLVEKKADLTLSSNIGRTPLHVAIESGHRDIVNFLLNQNCGVNTLDCFGSSPLFLAFIEYPDYMITKNLLGNGAEVNCSNLLLDLTLNCRSSKQIALVTLLLDHGANLHQIHPVSKQGVLHITAITNYVPLGLMLLNRGASLQVLDSTGRTPFQVAKSHKNQQIQNLYSHFSKN